MRRPVFLPRYWLVIMLAVVMSSWVYVAYRNVGISHSVDNATCHNYRTLHNLINGAGISDQILKRLGFNDEQILIFDANEKATKKRQLAILGSPPQNCYP